MNDNVGDIPTADQYQKSEVPTYLPKQNADLFNLRIDQNKSKVGPRAFDEFLDPFADSIAKSFMASQVSTNIHVTAILRFYKSSKELLRTKLDALRLKVQMSNQMYDERRGVEEFYTGVSSLDKLKMQFDVNRRRSDDRLRHLLKECYPNLDEDAITNMAKMVD